MNKLLLSLTAVFAFVGCGMNNVKNEMKKNLKIVPEWKSDKPEQIKKPQNKTSTPRKDGRKSAGKIGKSDLLKSVLTFIFFGSITAYLILEALKFYEAHDPFMAVTKAILGEAVLLYLAYLEQVRRSNRKIR